MPVSSSAYNRLINRPPWLGIKHIVWFNWHFYLYAILLIAAMAIGYQYMHGITALLLLLLLTGTILTLIISLVVSWYVYDLSGLYSLSWLNGILPATGTIVNIHAGFDETSALLQARYPENQLQVVDFYDPKKHTEWSIARARNVYPPFPGTVNISTATQTLPVKDARVILLILAAHEIRNDAERAAFFRTLGSSLSPGGRIVVVEHLRNLPNFLAYSIGAFHFLSWTSWKKTFQDSGLQIKSRKKINPFIHLIILANVDHTA
ncbi:MAG: methyltransferase [Chitinophagaceae bacterium]|nr:methyltransferase [Chitinophagaceae bacterium]